MRKKPRLRTVIHPSLDRSWTAVTMERSRLAQGRKISLTSLLANVELEHYNTPSLACSASQPIAEELWTDRKGPVICWTLFKHRRQQRTCYIKPVHSDASTLPDGHDSPQSMTSRILATTPTLAIYESKQIYCRISQQMAPGPNRTCDFRTTRCHLKMLVQMNSPGSVSLFNQSKMPKRTTDSRVHPGPSLGDLPCWVYDPELRL
jgi:hypothetical protein